jgi:hypothetical protein
MIVASIFDENVYLILTNEELAKLGIITDGNVFKYENATDTIKKCGLSEIIFITYPSMDLNIEKNGTIKLNNGLFASNKSEIQPL